MTRIFGRVQTWERAPGLSSQGEPIDGAAWRRDAALRTADPDRPEPIPSSAARVNSLPGAVGGFDPVEVPLSICEQVYG